MAKNGSADILLKLDADLASLRRNLAKGGDLVGAYADKSRRELSGVARVQAQLGAGFRQITAGARQLGGSALGAAGIGGLFGGATVAVIASQVREAVAYADAIGNVSKQADISAERLQTLRFAFQQVGAETDSADDALTDFADRLGEFTGRGSGEGAEVFKKLGIDSKILSDEIQTTEQAFDLFFNALSNVESGAERVSLAMAVMGDQGGKAIANLAGQGGLSELEKQAKAYGLVLSNELVGASQTFADEFQLTSQIISVNAKRLFLAVAPTLNALAQYVGEQGPSIAAYSERFLPDSALSLERLREKQLIAAQEALDQAQSVGGAQGVTPDRLIDLVKANPDRINEDGTRELKRILELEEAIAKAAERRRIQNERAEVSAVPQFVEQAKAAADQSLLLARVIGGELDPILGELNQDVINAAQQLGLFKEILDGTNGDAAIAAVKDLSSALATLKAAQLDAGIGSLEEQLGERLLVAQGAFEGLAPGALAAFQSLGLVGTEVTALSGGILQLSERASDLNDQFADIAEADLLAKVLKASKTEAQLLAEALKPAQALLNKGLINDEQFAKYSESLSKADDGTEAFAKNAAANLGRMVGQVENLDEALRQVLVTIAQDAFKTFLEPLLGKAGKAIGKNLFDLFFGGGSPPQGRNIRGGNTLTGVPQFAMGGVMTSSGPMPLRAYASGGIANSPQLALFGEGSRPEAYVPLPDGRSIPVTMSGFTPDIPTGAGGGAPVVNITQSFNVTAAGGDQAIARAVQQEMRAAAPETLAMTKAGVLSALDRGGNAAKRSGRR